MSVPLPKVPGSSNSFLDPEERYAVFQVKAKERPHLVSIDYSDKEEENDDSGVDPPLLDGCDIPAWRQEGLVGHISSDLLGALRIGAGCSLFRRDSQWPISTLHSNNKSTISPWQELREKLLIPPSEDIPRVDVQDVAQTVNGATRFALEWEQRNVPVLIENCTRDWKAMPEYHPEDECNETNFWDGGDQGGWT